MELDLVVPAPLVQALDADLQPAVEDGAMAIAEALQRIIAPYPPEPPRSRYQRTGRLGRGWEIRAISWGAELTNYTPYAGPVQGSPGQTKQHQQTGWPNENQAKQQIIDTGQAKQLMEGSIEEALNP